MIKRGISMLLVLTIVVCMFSAVSPVYAAEYETAELRICSDDTLDVYTVVVSDGDYYMAAEDFLSITRYEFPAFHEDYITYLLGTKTVRFSIEGTELVVSNGYTSHKTEYSGAIEKGGKVYLPMAEVLPWLSVNAHTEGNVLYLDSDPYTYWELCGSFVNRFNIADELGDDAQAAASLIAFNVFDGFLNLRLDKIIPVAVSNGSGLEVVSLNEYNSYVDFLLESASDDALVSNYGKDVLEVTKHVGKIPESLEEIFDGDIDLDYILKLSANDMEATNAWLEFDEAWQNTKLAGEAAGAIGDVMSSMKAIELAMKVTPEHLQTLECLEYYLDDDDAVMESAAAKAYASLKSSMSSIMMEMLSVGEDCLMGIGTDTIKEMIGGFAAPLSLVKATLSLVWPSLVDATEESAKLPVYGDVMDTSRALAMDFCYAGMDAEDVDNSRLMLILAYKASKKSYEAMDSYLSAFGGEGLLTYKINPIDAELVKLAFAGTCVENDSIEGKEERAAELESMLKTLLSSGNSISSASPDKAPEYRLIGVSEYSWDSLMRTSTIEYNNDGLISHISTSTQDDFDNDLYFDYNEKGLMTTCEQINEMLCSVWDYYYEDDCLVEESVYHDNGAYATTYYEYDNSGNLLRETTDEYEVYADTMIYSEVSYTNRNGRVVAAELTSSAYVDQTTEFSYHDTNPVVIKEEYSHYAAGSGGGMSFYVLLPNGRNADYEMAIVGNGISPFEPYFDDRGLLISADLGDYHVEFEYEKIGKEDAPISSLPDSDISYIIWLYEDKIYDVDGLTCAKVDVIESDVREASENELIVFSPDAEIWPWVGDDFLSHPSEYFADDTMATGGAYMIVDILDGYVISMSPFYDTWVFGME